MFLNVDRQQRLQTVFERLKDRQTSVMCRENEEVKKVDVCARVIERDQWSTYLLFIK